METWMIVALLVAVGLLIAYFVMRKKSTSNTPEVTARALTYARTLDAAPGVDPQTGEVQPNPPPPPPPDVKAPVVPPVVGGIIQRALRPSTTLSQIPIAGRPLVAASKLPAQAVNEVASRVNSTVNRVNNTAAKALEHIPVAGSVLAAPLKVNTAVSSAATSVAKKLTSWF